MITDNYHYGIPITPLEAPAKLELEEKKSHAPMAKSGFFGVVFRMERPNMLLYRSKKETYDVTERAPVSSG